MTAFSEVDKLEQIKIWDGVVARAVVGAEATFARIDLDPNTAVPEHHHVNEQTGMLLRGSMSLHDRRRDQGDPPGRDVGDPGRRAALGGGRPGRSDARGAVCAAARGLGGTRTASRRSGYASLVAGADHATSQPAHLRGRWDLDHRLRRRRRRCQGGRGSGRGGGRGHRRRSTASEERRTCRCSGSARGRRATPMRSASGPTRTAITTTSKQSSTCATRRSSSWRSNGSTPRSSS